MGLLWSLKLSEILFKCAQRPAEVMSGATSHFRDSWTYLGSTIMPYNKHNKKMHPTSNPVYQLWPTFSPCMYLYAQSTISCHKTKREKTIAKQNGQLHWHRIPLSVDPVKQQCQTNFEIMLHFCSCDWINKMMMRTSLCLNKQIHMYYITVIDLDIAILNMARKYDKKYI